MTPDEAELREEEYEPEPYTEGNEEETYEHETAS